MTRFTILLTTFSGTSVHHVQAETFVDAVREVYPGKEVFKVEIAPVGPTDKVQTRPFDILRELFTPRTIGEIAKGLGISARRVGQIYAAAVAARVPGLWRRG